MNKTNSLEVTMLVDYILEHEGESYYEYCKENHFDIDDESAIKSHIYGIACTVMKRKPSSYEG